MFKNKKIIISLILIIALVGGVMAVNASKYDSEKEVEYRLKKYGDAISQTEKGENEIVLEIEDRKITKKQFEIVGAAINTTDVNKIEEHFLKHIAIEKIAKEKNIIVSDDEVTKYLNDLKRAINSDNDSKESFNLYLSAKNMNEKEFWSSEDTFENYRNTITHGKVRGEIRKKYMEQDPNMSINEIERLSDKELNEMIEKKSEKFKINFKYQ